MTHDTSLSLRDQIDALFRSESRRVFATLVRLLNDFDLAEEAMQAAFAAASERWPQAGMPENPRAWLVATGKFHAIDALRRQGRWQAFQPEIAARLAKISAENAGRAAAEIEDDRLRLIFTCCHPALDLPQQVALTLREVCGLATDEIAHAFLLPPATLAQRIVRAKAKLRAEQIPFVVPPATEWPERLDAVLAVIYLVFSEGYAASQGAALLRVDLSGEAIRLGRLLEQLLPEPEVQGLLALMLLQESRREARVSATGELLLLDEQDRGRWDQTMISAGVRLVTSALSAKRPGRFTLQAAIATVHAQARSAAATDWQRIVELYSALLVLDPSPIVELNRAVAVAMRDGPVAGLALVDALLQRGELREHHRAHATRAELCRRAGKLGEAKAAYETAIGLTRQEPERRYLLRRLAELP